MYDLSSESEVYMGKINTAMRCFLQNRRRFADLFNGILYDGQTVIHPEDLQEASEQYSALKNKPSDRNRDIKMSLNTGETLRILALENQNRVDYTLPYRCMQYDSLEYGRQLNELKQSNKERNLLHMPAERLCGITKKDRLTPVYTLCLYHGEEPWDGPLALRDMMDFGSDRDGMSRFFADYPLRLFCVNEQSDFDRFHTELREVFTAMNYRRDKKRLYTAMEENPAFQKLNEDTIRVLSVLLDAPRIWKEKEKFMHLNDDEEEYDMCQAMRELLEDAKNDGINQGIRQGLTQGLSQGVAQGLSQGLNQGIGLINLLVQKLLADDRLEDLKKSVTDSAFQQQLLKEYKLTD